MYEIKKKENDNDVINKLTDIDVEVLKELIMQSVVSLKEMYPE